MYINSVNSDAKHPWNLNYSTEHVYIALRPLIGVGRKHSRTQFHVNIQFHRVVGDDYTNNWTLIKRNYKATSI